MQLPFYSQGRDVPAKSESGVGWTQFMSTCRITRCSSIRRMWLSQFHLLSLAPIMTSSVASGASSAIVRSVILDSMELSGETDGFTSVFGASWTPFSRCLPLQQPGGVWAAYRSAHSRAGKLLHHTKIQPRRQQAPILLPFHRLVAPRLQRPDSKTKCPIHIETVPVLFTYDNMLL